MAVRTHYDALEVARSATPEVISAAYRSLSKRYHPDRNRGDPAAETRMAELNAAYAVLADEDRREEHDRWIATQERPAAPAATTDAARTPARFEPPPGTVRRELLWWLAGGIAVGVTLIVGLTIELDRPADPPAPMATVPAPQPARAEAPAGSPARYMDAASANDGGGRSRVTLDNSGGTTAVEVELLPDTPGGAYRRLYLPAGGFFTMEQVRGGRYRLAFRDLGDDSRSTGEPFQLGAGGQPGDVTVRLARE